MDLLGIKLQANDPVIEFLERFRRVKGKCSVQLSKVKFASIEINNMNSQLREKLNISEYGDLAQLS